MLNLFLGKWIETLVPAYMAESIREEVKEELSFLIACLETDHRRKPLMHVSTAAKKKDRTEEKLLSRDGPWQVGPYHKTWLLHTTAYITFAVTNLLVRGMNNKFFLMFCPLVRWRVGPKQVGGNLQREHPE